MTLIKTAALLLAVTALPAAAQTGADKPKPEKKVCRTYEETGSIMGGKKICHTKAEWTAIDQRNGDAVSAQRDLAGQGGNGSGRF